MTTEKAIETVRIELLKFAESSFAGTKNLMARGEFLAAKELMERGSDNLRHINEQLATARRVAHSQKRTIDDLRNWATKRHAIEAEARKTEASTEPPAKRLAKENSKGSAAAEASEKKASATKASRLNANDSARPNQYL